MFIILESIAALILIIVIAIIIGMIIEALKKDSNDNTI